MKKLITTVLLLTLCAAMCLTLFGCNKKKTTPEMEYTLNEDGKSYSVTSIGTVTDTDIVIAATYNDKPVTSIGDNAFRDCNRLKSIEIPSSVKSIGHGAFDGCSGLTSVKFGENSQLTSIGVCAFRHCYALTSIEIPSGVTNIGVMAFGFCVSLGSIEIPASVTSIGRLAFAMCNSFTLKFSGTVEQWKAIPKGSELKDFTEDDFITITCSDGTLTNGES